MADGAKGSNDTFHKFRKQLSVYSTLHICCAVPTSLSRMPRSIISSLKTSASIAADETSIHPSEFLVVHFACRVRPSCGIYDRCEVVPHLMLKVD